MKWAVLLLLCGCNPLYGIESTALWDAPADSPPPPPPMCPAIGGTPTFTSDLNQVAARGVYSFSLDASEGLATGMVPNPTLQYDVPVIGPIGAALQPVTMNPPPAWPSSVRLSPEGDMLFVTWWPGPQFYATSGYKLVNGTWTEVGNRFAPENISDQYAYYNLSAPSRGPTRRFIGLLVDRVTQVVSMVELEYDGTTATELSRTPHTDLGVGDMAHANLSADGLRLVFVASEIGDDSMSTASGILRFWYMDRPNLTLPFQGPARLVTSVPDNVNWPQLSDDCGRVYFYALNTTWYLELAQ